MIEAMPAVSLMRVQSVAVTNTEVFFDLVYAFAFTQLSHYLLEHATVDGAAVALVVIMDRRHGPTDSMLALLAQEAR